MGNNKNSAVAHGNGISVTQWAQHSRGAPVRNSIPSGSVGFEVNVFTIISKQTDQNEYESGWCILDAGLLEAAKLVDINVDALLEELCAQLGRELVYVEKAIKLTLDHNDFKKSAGGDTYA